VGVILPYTPMPDGAAPRPLVDVMVADAVTVKALVDSGAVNTLFASWVADAAGIDLTGANTLLLNVGGGSYEAKLVTVRLATEGYVWEAEVGFCGDWHIGWALAGHWGFFRFFNTAFRAVDHEFEIDHILE
jgi:hypothetical protein